jgi:DNA-binding response OmpR family regulator
VTIVTQARRGFRSPRRRRTVRGDGVPDPGSAQRSPRTGRKLALGGPKQRAVLAHLILRANHVVPTDLLIDGLWGEEPPESARNTVQTYVYRLRKVLGDGRLEGRDGG